MRFIIFSLICLSLIQCTSRPSENKPYTFNKVRQITLQNMEYPDIIGIGMQLVQIDSLLIINDFHGDSLLNVYDSKHHILKKRLVSKGNGPDDMVSPLDISLCNDKLYILSRPLFRFSYISKDNILESHPQMYGHTQLPQMSDRFLPLNDSLFVFSGMWEKRYALYQKNKIDSLRIFGDYPTFWSEEKDIPTMPRAMFHQCEIVKHPKKNLFASASNYVLEIFSFDPTGKELPHLEFRKKLGNYEYTFSSGNMISTQCKENSDPRVLRICCTEQYLYLLREVKDNEDQMEICVIDWDGNPIELLKADKKITTLIINEAQHKGFCLADDPECMLYSFDI